jgi:hypothetical protein
LNQDSKWTALLAATLIATILYAFYTGFRAPNLWSVNYYQISYLDGFYRRALLGTFLFPLGCVRFDYFFVAKIQFLILFLALSLFIYIGIKNRSFLTLNVFFLSSAGGYLFHEVGYVDQLLWIFAAMAILALYRDRLYLASLFLCLSIMAHEMALFTAVPIVLAYVLIQKKPTKLAYIKIFAMPMMLFFLISLLFEVVPIETIRQYVNRAIDCGVVPKLTYFEMYSHHFDQRAKLYYSWEQFYMAILPIAILSFTLVVPIRKKLKFHPFQNSLIFVCCLSPLLLGLFGWDTSRWIFLAFAQVIIISFIASSELRLRGSGNALVGTPFVIALVLVGLLLRLEYFDRFSPRVISFENLKSFPSYVAQQLTVLPRL